MAFVGIDVGGTRIKLGLVKQKKMVSSSVFEVKNNHSLEANLPLIMEEIKALRFAFDASEPIEGIGMALPCLIDHKKNKILKKILANTCCEIRQQIQVCVETT